MILVLIFAITLAGCGGISSTPPLPADDAVYIWGVAVDVDGSDNVYVAGTTNSTFEGNTNAGGRDMFLVKYDSTGSKQWTRQLGSSAYDIAHGVAVDGSGSNVYITGLTEGGLDWNTNAGGRDMFLIKYDSTGSKQWTRQLGSSGRELPCGVIADSSDNVYVTGTTNGAFEGNTNIGDFHMFLIKYNASGVKQL